MCPRRHQWRILLLHAAAFLAHRFHASNALHATSFQPPSQSAWVSGHIGTSSCTGRLRHGSRLLQNFAYHILSRREFWRSVPLVWLAMGYIDYSGKSLAHLAYFESESLSWTSSVDTLKSVILAQCKLRVTTQSACIYSYRLAMVFDCL